MSDEHNAGFDGRLHRRAKWTLTLGTVSSKSVDNSASKASFAINATVTIGGAFLTTNSFGILPITSMNGLPIGDGKVGPVTRRLMEAFGPYTAEHGTPF